jgi:hypothetical protein
MVVVEGDPGRLKLLMPRYQRRLLVLVTEFLVAEQRSEGGGVDAATAADREALEAPAGGTSQLMTASEAEQQGLAVPSGQLDAYGRMQSMVAASANGGKRCMLFAELEELHLLYSISETQLNALNPTS